MKKLFFCFSTAAMLAACNNNGTSKTNTDTGSAPNLTNVQNVNGNQPDTANGIKLDNSQSGDTTKKTDTSHH